MPAIVLVFLSRDDVTVIMIAFIYVISMAKSDQKLIIVIATAARMTTKYQYRGSKIIAYYLNVSSHKYMKARGLMDE